MFLRPTYDCQYFVKLTNKELNITVCGPLLRDGGCLLVSAGAIWQSTGVQIKELNITVCGSLLRDSGCLSASGCRDHVGVHSMYGCREKHKKGGDVKYVQGGEISISTAEKNTII